MTNLFNYVGNKGQGNRGISSLQFRYSEWETVNLINLHYNFSKNLLKNISLALWGEGRGEGLILSKRYFASLSMTNAKGYYNIANECEAIQPIFQCRRGNADLHN